jgi:hypothetical protein
MGQKPSLETICQASVSRKSVHRHGKQRTRLKGWHGRLVAAFTHWRKTIEICDVSLASLHSEARKTENCTLELRGTEAENEHRDGTPWLRRASSHPTSDFCCSDKVSSIGNVLTYIRETSNSNLGRAINLIFQANVGTLPSIRHDHFQMTTRHHYRSRDSSVGTATRLWDGLPKSRGSNAGKCKRFSSSSEHPDRLCDPPNLIQEWVLVADSPKGVKLTAHLHLVATLEMVELCFHSPIRLHGVVLN